MVAGMVVATCRGPSRAGERLGVATHAVLLVAPLGEVLVEDGRPVRPMARVTRPPLPAPMSCLPSGELREVAMWADVGVDTPTQARSLRALAQRIPAVGEGVWLPTSDAGVVLMAVSTS